MKKTYLLYTLVFTILLAQLSAFGGVSLSLSPKDTAVKAGGEFVVDVNVGTDTSLISVMALLLWDSSKLEFVEYIVPEAFDDLDNISVGWNVEDKPGMTVVGVAKFFQNVLTADNQGTIAQLKFKVKDGVAIGTAMNFTLSLDRTKYRNAEIGVYTSGLDVVDATLTGATAKVAKLFNVSSWETTFDDGWMPGEFLQIPLGINVSYTDENGEAYPGGKVTAIDAANITVKVGGEEKDYTAGKYGVFTLSSNNSGTVNWDGEVTEFIGHNNLEFVIPFIATSNDGVYTDTNTMTMTVIPANNLPVLSDFAIVTEDEFGMQETLKVKFTFTISDVDGDATNPVAGSVKLNGEALAGTFSEDNGVWTFTGTEPLSQDLVPHRVKDRNSWGEYVIPWNITIGITDGIEATYIVQNSDEDKDLWITDVDREQSAPIFIGYEPATPTTGDDVTVKYDHSEDEDGDNIGYYVEWICKDKYHEGRTLPATMTQKGEKWMATVTAITKPFYYADEHEWGEVWAMTECPEFTIGNAAPTLSAATESILIRKGGATSRTVEFTIFDADAADLFTVTANGVKGTTEVSAINDGKFTVTYTVNDLNTEFEDGSFTVKVNDGEDDSNTVTVAVTYRGNEPAVIISDQTEFTIEEVDAEGKATELLLTVKASDSTDTAPYGIKSIVWTITDGDGIVFASETNKYNAANGNGNYPVADEMEVLIRTKGYDTLDRDGDQDRAAFSVTVTVEDALGAIAVQQFAVTVYDVSRPPSAPTAIEVRYDGGNVTGGRIIATASGAVDPDGDEVFYRFELYIDGELYEGTEEDIAEGEEVEFELELYKGNVPEVKVFAYDVFGSRSEGYSKTLELVGNCPPEYKGDEVWSVYEYVPGYNDSESEFDIKFTDYFDDDYYDEDYDYHYDGEGEYADGYCLVYDPDAADGKDSLTFTLDATRLKGYADAWIEDGKIFVYRNRNVNTGDLQPLDVIGETEGDEMPFFVLTATDEDGGVMSQKIYLEIIPVNESPTVMVSDIVVDSESVEFEQEFNVNFGNSADEAEQTIAECVIDYIWDEDGLLEDIEVVPSGDGKRVVVRGAFSEDAGLGAMVRVSFRVVDDGGRPAYDASNYNEVTITKLKVVTANGVIYGISGGYATIIGVEDTSVFGLVIPSEIEGAEVANIGRGAFDDCRLYFVQTDSEYIRNWFEDEEDVWIIGMDKETPVYVAQDGIVYGIYEGEAFVAGPVDDELTVANIASEVNGAPVTLIDVDAFEECESLAEVTLPSSLKIIGRHAFAWCSSLTSIELPDGLQIIREGAFKGTGLVSAVIPDSVIALGSVLDDYEEACGVFDDCENLQFLVIGSGVTQMINNYDIYPEYVQTDNKYVAQRLATWEDSENVQVIGMDGTPAPEPYTTFVNGVKYLIKNNVAIVKGVEDDSIVEIAIPAEVDGFPVTTIGSRAFEDCENLANVTLPEGLLVIGEGAFYGCTALTHIDLPEGLLYIEGYDGGAFSGCTALESIALPEGLLSIGSGTFYGCESLVTVTCPSTLLMIGYEAFEDCYALESVILNEGLKEIGYDAFAYCESLKSITIPASVWYLGGDDDCFNGCTSLESINVAEGNEYYAFRDGVLYNADFTELLTYPNRKKEETFTLPATVTSVNPLSNDNPNLKTILVEDGNKYFESRDGVLYRNYVYMEGGNVVSEFTALVWYPGGRRDPVVTIPDDVLGVHDYAFSRRASRYIYGLVSGKDLQQFHIKGYLFPDLIYIIRGDIWGAIYLEQHSNTLLLSDYDEAPVLRTVTKDGLRYLIVQDGEEEWARFLGVEDATVTEMRILDEVDGVPVTEISTVAFEGAYAVESLYIPAKITVLTMDYSLPNLKSIEVSEDNTAFTAMDGVLYSKDMTKLVLYPPAKEDESFTVPYECVFIGARAFAMATSLTSVNMPDVCQFDYHAFVGCKNLEYIVIGQDYEFYSRYDIFDGCKSFNTVFTSNVEAANWFEDNMPQVTVRPMVSDFLLDGILYRIKPGMAIIQRYVGGNYVIDQDVDDDWEDDYGDDDDDYYGDDDDDDDAYLRGGDDDDDDYYDDIDFFGDVTEIVIPEKVLGCPVVSIWEEAFSNCPNLASITLPDSVEFIGFGAFAYTSLTSFRVPASLELNELEYDEEWGWDGWWGVLAQIETLESIEVAEGNANYVVVDGVLYSADMKRLLCRPPMLAGRSFAIPDSVEVIDEFACSNCIGLKKIDIPASVTMIGDGAFLGCTGLKSATLPEAVTEINEGVFQDCTALAEVIIPDGLESIGPGNFEDCSSLVEIVIGDGVSYMDEYAFYDLDSLETVYTDNEVVSDWFAEHMPDVVILPRNARQGVLNVLDLNGGWNLISPTMQLTDDSVDAIMALNPKLLDVNRNVYVRAHREDIVPGMPLWVFLGEELKVTLHGTPVDDYAVDIYPGWNLVGIVDDIELDALPSGIQTILEWNGYAYVEAEFLEAGKGYWIYGE